LFLDVKQKQWQDPRITAAMPVLAASLYSPTLKNTVFIQGIDFFSAMDFSDPESAGNTSHPFTLNKSTFALLTEPDTIAIGAELARRGNLKTGDVIAFNVGAQLAHLRIVQILNTAQSRHAFGGDFAVT